MSDAQKKEGPKDGLALIVGGLFILALVFATYNYFSKSSKNAESDKIQTEEVFQKEEKPSEKTETAKGDLNGNGAKDTTKSSGTTAVLGTGGPVSQVTSESWVANNYKQGDIKGNSYTVKSGDTLWEIAEAAYGNGAEWTKILEANKSSIGFLPNGSQALIKVGQVLVLP
jgi:nucleoid-associated protein YgaU